MPKPTEYQMSFSDKGFDLAIGSVFGLRSYSLLYKPDPERPDEPITPLLRGSYVEWPEKTMVAQCVFKIATFYWFGGTKQDLPPEEQNLHPAPDPDCQCGIYAYWTPELDWAYSMSGIYAVVEATGPTILGSKGFRTSRARIVGLAITQKACETVNRILYAPNAPQTYSFGSSSRASSPCPDDTLPPPPSPEIPIIIPLEEIQSNVSQQYDLPVYSSTEELIQHHPLTSDYLPVDVQPPLPDPPKIEKENQEKED